MSGRPWLPPRARADVAAAVATARAGGVRWKEIAEWLGMSERQLRRYLGRASRETMSENSSGMSDQRPCAKPAAA